MKRTELSLRELQVLGAIGYGHRIKAIARALNLSIKTVSTYKTRAADKVGIAGNDHIVAYVEAQKWPEPEFMKAVGYAADPQDGGSQSKEKHMEGENTQDQTQENTQENTGDAQQNTENTGDGKTEGAGEAAQEA